MSRERRRRSAEAVMMDAVPAREKLLRCPLYSVTITGEFGDAREVVTDSGLLLTGKVDKDKIPQVSPSWNYKKQLRHTANENLPRSLQLLLHMGEQRLYMKHSLGENRPNTRLLLDLSKSCLRDRILLHKGMRLVFRFQDQIREIYVAEVPKTDVVWAWDWKVDEKDFLSKTLSGSPVEALSGASSSDQTMSTEPDLSFSDSSNAGAKVVKHQRTSDMSKRSITWSKTVTVVSEKMSEVEEMQDQMEETESEPSLAEVEPTLVLSSGDRPEESVTLNWRRRSIFFGSPSPDLANALAFDETATVVPLFHSAPGVFAAISLCPEGRQAYLVLPRINHMDGVSVQLVIPEDTTLPVSPGDLLVLESLQSASNPSMRKRALEVRIRGHRIVRSAPDDRQTAETTSDDQNPLLFDSSLDASQTMKDIGVETRHQQKKKRWNGAVELASNTTPLTFFFKGSYFATDRRVTLGRSSCDISIADPYLSKHHATIFRQRNKYFLLQPENKAVYLLLGKKDTHARPPLPLRTGDILTIGKSDFKVVFQQRGNGIVSATREEELRYKVPSPGRPGCEVKMAEDPQKSSRMMTEDQQRERAAIMVKAESDDYVPPPVFDNLEAVLMQFGLTRSATEPMMMLMSIRGPRRGAFFVCRSLETTIGSSRDADISVPNDRRMTGLHARVYFDTKERRWMVQDLMSRNGTFIKFEGTDPILLTFGDIFVMGLTSIKVLGTPQPSSTSRYACAPQ